MVGSHPTDSNPFLAIDLFRNVLDAGGFHFLEWMFTNERGLTGSR